ncbi:MAG TPA: CotH kinase family protein [Polyangia bacterium]|nr:CotH kinase family protein [Polyangia bacterium]
MGKIGGAWWAGVALAVALGGCSSSKGAAGDAGTRSGSGGSTGSGGGSFSGNGAGGGGNNGDASVMIAGGPSCPDLFDQNQVRTYSLDIAPADWQAIMAEFNDTATLLAQGNDFVSRHPVVFHLGSETVSDATLKLHGQSSWAQTVMLDGARAKIQFDISFHQSNPNGKFHGVEKLVFDMPRSDWTFMHDRLSHAWLRQIGIAAGCAANARVEINGSYYGMYVAEENTNKRILAEFFPSNTGGLWKAGIQPETALTVQQQNLDRQATFAQAYKAGDFASVSAIVDLPSSVVEFASEAILNNADGTYGGNHNFYIYDQGQPGFVYLPNDTDSTFDWMALFDQTPANDHPIYFWANRAAPKPMISPVYLAAINDPATRKQYVDAIATQLGKWNVGQVQGWIDTWSQQIEADVTADPHTWATPDQFQMAVSKAHDIVGQRAQFLQSFVDCERNGTGADQDGDGVRWCDDCDDSNPAVHPGAAEICGNGIDDNCNGQIDEGCH